MKLFNSSKMLFYAKIITVKLKRSLVGSRMEYMTYVSVCTSLISSAKVLHKIVKALPCSCSMHNKALGVWRRC